MIWDRVPKSRYCGFAKMELGVYDAVTHFNLGKGTIENVFNTLNIEPGLLEKCVNYSTRNVNILLGIKKWRQQKCVVKTLGRKSNGKRIKSLTTDTADCFVHTCKGLVELAISLLSIDHEYVMLGYCFVHTCKGLVELAISLLGIDHEYVMLGYCFVHTCKGLVELAISLLSIDHEYVMLGYCFVHTCKGLVELAISLLGIDHEYVMLGYFTSDFIEEYGKLQPGSGGTYFISVQQIIEKVTINKTKVLLKLDVDITNFNINAGLTARVADFYLPKICAQVLTVYQNWKNCCRMTQKCNYCTLLVM